MSADLAALLHGPRLPEAFAQLGADDLLACAGLGLLLAALILSLGAPFLSRRPSRPSLKARVQALRPLPEPERLLQLARLMVELGLPIPEPQRQALYQGSGGAPEVLERLILGARRRE